MSNEQERCAHRFVSGSGKGGTCGLPREDVLHRPDVQDARYALLPGLNLAHAFVPPAEPVKVETWTCQSQWTCQPEQTEPVKAETCDFNELNDYVCGNPLPCADHPAKELTCEPGNVCPLCGEVSPPFMKVSSLHRGDCPGIDARPDTAPEQTEREAFLAFDDWHDQQGSRRPTKRDCFIAGARWERARKERS